MSEILNLEAIEQQRILITVSLTGSDGAPVSPSDYVICAAAIGQPNPYTQRAVRKEWAASINNENSAFLLTCPGLDMAAAPWKYRILLKNRALELEWQIVSGRISLTPRACGTDGISPAAYSINAECTPSGLVNVSLDATVGSISGTLEEVKASAALASSSAANAHADLEDARKAAATAAQAATTAAADAKTAAEAATRAEQAATDAPQACAPFVGQVQAAAVQAQQAATNAEEDANRASTAATTATEKAQVATDAAAAAATSATDIAAARDTAVQAASTAQAAQQAAQLASTTATTAAENAREYAEDAQQAKQAAASSESNAAASAQQASDSASAAAASAASAQASADTAVSAKSDLETARDTATAAATTATEAATAAASSETNATAAATAAATAQTAAEAAQAQADTDARACAIYDQRVAANATAAADSATAAADSETAAAASATAAAASAQELLDEELGRMVDLAAACYAIMQANPDVKYDYTSEPVSLTDTRARIALRTDTSVVVNTQILVSSKVDFVNWPSWTSYAIRVYYAPRAEGFKTGWSNAVLDKTKPVYIHMPACKNLNGDPGNFDSPIMIFSNETVFDYLVYGFKILTQKAGSTVVWNEAAITMPRLKDGNHIFYGCKIKSLPDGITFENLENAEYLVSESTLEKMPTNTNFGKVNRAPGAFYKCTQMEIDEIVRVCNTLQDLQALETPTTAALGLPVTCKHNGASVDCKNYLNGNYPDFLLTLAAKGWTVSFG